MTKRIATLAAACAIALAGCSSKPRNFAPVLAAAPADARAYQAQWLDCRDQVAGTKHNGSGRLGSAAGGAAAGVGAGAAAGAAVSGATVAGYGAAAAAAAATLMVVPVVGLAGAWGVSKIKKTKKEKAIKAATAECLAQAGYSVESWRVMSKKEVRALPAAQFEKPVQESATGEAASEASQAPR